MKKPSRIILAACALISIAVTAQAEPIPVWLGLTPESQLTVTIDALGGSVSASATTGLHGNVHALIDWTEDSIIGPFATMFGVEAFDINADDFGLELDLGPQLGSLMAAAQGVHLGGSGPLASFFQATGGPGLTPMSWFDLAGTTLAADDGVITYEGTGGAGALFPPGTFDFAADPAQFVLPAGSSVKVIEDPIVPGQKANVTLLLPFSVATLLTTDAGGINATISGMIVATGMKIIPEPASWLLIGLGLTGIIPLVRRRFCRRVGRA